MIRKLGEWPAPADAIRTGEQKSPALAASPLLPGGALITVWEDHGRLLPGRPASDLMLEFRPVPFVHRPPGFSMSCNSSRRATMTVQVGMPALFSTLRRCRTTESDFSK